MQHNKVRFIFYQTSARTRNRPVVPSLSYNFASLYHYLPRRKFTIIQIFDKCMTKKEASLSWL